MMDHVLDHSGTVQTARADGLRLSPSISRIEIDPLSTGALATGGLPAGSRDLTARGAWVRPARSAPGARPAARSAPVGVYPARRRVGASDLAGAGIAKH